MDSSGEGYIVLRVPIRGPTIFQSPPAPLVFRSEKASSRGSHENSSFGSGSLSCQNSVGAPSDFPNYDSQAGLAHSLSESGSHSLMTMLWMRRLIPPVMRRRIENDLCSFIEMCTRSRRVAISRIAGLLSSPQIRAGPLKKAHSLDLFFLHECLQEIFQRVTITKSLSQKC